MQRLHELHGENRRSLLCHTGDRRRRKIEMRLTSQNLMPQNLVIIVLRLNPRSDHYASLSGHTVQLLVSSEHEMYRVPAGG